MAGMMHRSAGYSRHDAIIFVRAQSMEVTRASIFCRILAPERRYLVLYPMGDVALQVPFAIWLVWAGWREPTGQTGRICISALVYSEREGYPPPGKNR